MIEKHFDIPFIADLALREKQIQQNYRPIIAVHKWFARRPGTLFRGLMLAEFAGAPLRETFYAPHKFHELNIADPFMGGGTPLLEANRIGCNTTGCDINPMSCWIVEQEMAFLDLAAYADAARDLLLHLEEEVGHLYRTRCTLCGNEEAHVKYFLWVKTASCRTCGKVTDLFPGYLLAGNARHPKNVFVCSVCGKLTETADRNEPGHCIHCGERLSTKGTTHRNTFECAHCGYRNSFPQDATNPPSHRLFALEYHCPACKPGHAGRFFKSPDQQDLSRLEECEDRWRKISPRFVPDDTIPPGDETNRLHRWGYRHYREMFNARQLLGLELSARYIAAVTDPPLRNALATNLSDLLRYQNMLCRYDTSALKSLDIFSVHGFPVGLVQCESNILGISAQAKESCIGSGGWRNIIEKYRKAKTYCFTPFEIRHRGRNKETVSITGEKIEMAGGNAPFTEGRQVSLHCMDAAELDLPESSLDGVFTDPPYFGNVQYAELIDFCYVWLRRLVGTERAFFAPVSTRHDRELTGNQERGRGLPHFAEGLSAVFRRMAYALKPGAPLAFTYHHNSLEAYFPIAAALLDAGLTCSASLPCPAEMGASIHINGTGSSIIDTVFVCRTTGTVSRYSLPDSSEELFPLIRRDIEHLRQGGVTLTLGDVRCLIYGHLIRLTVWYLRKSWDSHIDTEEKLSIIDAWTRQFGIPPATEAHLNTANLSRLHEPRNFFRKRPDEQGADHDDTDISF